MTQLATSITRIPVSGNATAGSEFLGFTVSTSIPVALFSRASDRSVLETGWPR